MTQIAILGTGLIGSSIGLRLKGQTEHEFEVIGFDRYHDTARAAQRVGAIDTIASSVRQAVRDADLVVLAAPVLGIRVLLRELAGAVGPATVITDVGSTKADVMRWVDEYLPNHTGFVGGHPMAGKTEVGPTHADANLFEGARWVIVPMVRSAPYAIESVTNLALNMGAAPMLMDAEEHDSYAAAISHMPMLAAMALFSMERASEAWPELSMLAAGGFKDMTRLSMTDAGMANDILVTNRDNTVHWLNRYIGALLEIRDRLSDEEGEEEFFKLLAATEFEYSAYRLGKVGRDESKPIHDSAEFSFQDFIAGAWVRERINQMAKDSDERLREMETRQRRERELPGSSDER